MVEALSARRESLENRHRSWRPTTLDALLDQVADEHPDRPFVIVDPPPHPPHPPHGAGAGMITYRAMAEWSTRLARGLVAGGIAPGERVALYLPNGADMIAARFAIARAGAVAVPVNARLKAQELGEILEQSRAAALVTMERTAEVAAFEALDAIAPGWDGSAPTASERDGTFELKELRLVVAAALSPDARCRRPAVTTLAELERGPDPTLDNELERRRAASSATDTATIFFTSGTTGRPKGVVSTHEMELRSAYGSAYTRGFEDGRRILFALPLTHVFAYVEGLLSSMFVGGSVAVQAAFDPVATLRAVERHRPGEALFVPTMSLAVVDAARRGDPARDGAPYDVSSLHTVMSAAQSAPARLWRDLFDTLGLTTCVTAYGMTETSAATTFTEPGAPIEDLVETVGRPKPGGIAGDPALSGYLAEYKAVDPVTLKDVPPGTPGELVARGPIVCRSYFERPEETADTIMDGGWLRSGDLGYVRADGSLVLTGRAKELYKCGGELVMPTEVEAWLAARPGVAQAYVVGVPDPRMGEVGCAWVVPDGATPDPTTLIAECRQALARFKVPAYVRFIGAADLPLTTSGKVQKYKLAQRAADELGLIAAT